MIGSLKGILLEKFAPDALIDVNGVGYEVSLPMTSFYKLPKEGEQVFVYTCFIVREDAQALYAFMDREDKMLFKELIKVSGIGPKMALAVLSTFNTEELIAAVKKESVTALTKIPGVGKKTAERMVIELKDKISKWNFSNSSTVLNGNVTTETESLNPTKAESLIIDIDTEEQAVNALIGLGLAPKQASSSVHKLYKEGMSVEDLIRGVLANN